jgi:hypothetical protein
MGGMGTTPCPTGLTHRDGLAGVAGGLLSPEEGVNFNYKGRYTLRLAHLGSSGGGVRMQKRFMLLVVFLFLGVAGSRVAHAQQGAAPPSICGSRYSSGRVSGCAVPRECAPEKRRVGQA